jgi:hypothetical protein
MTPSPLSSRTSDNPPGGRLDGWKEIAGYLAKSVRTVQRWEKELGLPIHRVGSGRGESVHALVEELERWRETPPARRAEREAETAEPAEPAPPELPTAGAPAVAPVAPQPHEVLPPAGGAGRSARGKPVTFREWITATPLTDWIISLAVMLITVVATVWALRPIFTGGGTPGPTGETSLPRAPASWEVTGNALRIYDANKGLLWAHRFDFPLHQESYEESVRARNLPVLMDELDGDGRVEVLFVSEPGLVSSRGLYCFNQDGTLRFRHQPERTVRFGSTDYTGPWRASRIFTTSRPNEPKSVWLVSYHVSGFPAVLERLSPAGQVTGEYWTSGQVASVEVSPPGGRRLVFVGATDDEHRDASLAVLDESRPMGVNPSASSSYQCEGCPPGTPVAFLLFPRIEAARVVDSFAIVDDIRIDAFNQVIVSVRHETTALIDENTRGKSRTRYFLDAAFRILNGEFDPSYRSVHAQLEKARLVDHPFGPRDERDLWPVLRWDRDKFVRIERPESDRR